MYLLGLDQLKVAEFTAVEAAHTVDAAAVAAGDTALAATVRNAGLGEAATVRYFRAVPELATANGPVDVRSTVLRFGGSAAAHDVYAGMTRHTDAVPSIVPESAGVLGDEAHGDVVETLSPSGVHLVEATVTWRVANLVSVLVVRGRSGGTGLGDALILAHAQAAGER